MGLMPLVAPYISEARKRHDLVQQSLKDAHALLAKATPTLFVEGETDRRALLIAWRLFATSSDQIQIHSGGGDYGSANAVTSRVLAWLLEVRHKPTADRKPVVALFDRDQAGAQAHSKLNKEISGLHLTSLPHSVMFYPAGARVARLRKSGFQVPQDLESLYSDRLWELAKKRGWIEQRVDLSTMLSGRLVADLVNKGSDPFAELEESDRLRVTMTFTDAGKSKALQAVEAANAGEQRKLLASFEPLISALQTALLGERT